MTQTQALETPALVQSDSDGRHDYRDLIRIFNDLFVPRYQTELIAGDDEPIYLPADEEHPLNRVVFAHGYFASALHEIAHWCIAGKQRRTQVDFGYWYRPDGRTAEQQMEFQRVEVKPQALEWIFASAAGFPFHFSEDNLGGEALDMADFKARVADQAATFLETSPPRRARDFARALAEFYGTPWPMAAVTPARG